MQLDERRGGGNRVALATHLAKVPDDARPRPDSQQQEIKRFVDMAYNKKVWQGEAVQSVAAPGAPAASSSPARAEQCSDKKVQAVNLFDDILEMHSSSSTLHEVPPAPPLVSYALSTTTTDLLDAVPKAPVSATFFAGPASFDPFAPPPGTAQQQLPPQQMPPQQMLPQQLLPQQMLPMQATFQQHLQQQPCQYQQQQHLHQQQHPMMPQFTQQHRPQQQLQQQWPSPANGGLFSGLSQSVQSSTMSSCSAADLFDPFSPKKASEELCVRA